jgi:hypothetical protein
MGISFASFLLAAAVALGAPARLVPDCRVTTDVSGCLVAAGRLLGRGWVPLGGWS